MNFMLAEAASSTATPRVSQRFPPHEKITPSKTIPREIHASDSSIQHSGHYQVCHKCFLFVTNYRLPLLVKKISHTEIYDSGSGHPLWCPICFLSTRNSPLKNTVVSVCVLLMCNLFAMLKFLVYFNLLLFLWIACTCHLHVAV